MVSRAAGKSAGAANGRTAQAAAESSPDPGSPSSRTSPRSVSNPLTTRASAG